MEIKFLQQTLIFYPCIIATRCRRPFIFQTINSVRLKHLSLKYQRFTTSEMEFKEFEQRFKSVKTRFKLSAGLNLKTFNTILSGTNHI